MKKLFYFFILSLQISFVHAQVDSSNIYAKIITGGKSKNWYSRYSIPNNPRQGHHPTLVFNLNPKTGTVSKFKGRDMVGSFKDFRGWSIKKQNDRYLLMISTQEKYFISIDRSDKLSLVIENVPDNKKNFLTLTGHFFETPDNNP